MILDCREQVERLLTPERLQYLFLQLGAAEDIKNGAPEFSVSKLANEPYQDRDWSCLQTFIELLGCISAHLSVPAVRYAVKTLLRMSMDRLLIYSIDLLNAYQDSVQGLVNAIPGPSWDSFVRASNHQSPLSYPMLTSTVLRGKLVPFRRYQGPKHTGGLAAMPSRQ